MRTCKFAKLLIPLMLAMAPISSPPALPPMANTFSW